jgi:mannose-1-phosphate guanylyltransferase
VIAVILVGGQGTRLRPLTDWLPKARLPVANRPFLEHQIAYLHRHGVTRVILSCGYRPDAIRDHFGDTLEYMVEDSPLGTGGAIEHAARGLEETFVVCNGDVLTDLDLTSLVAFHRDRAARATIALHRVDDPTRFGLVRTDDRGAVLAFVEKPAADETDVDTINAGTYVLEPSVLRLVEPGIPTSVERHVFPRLVGDGLFARIAPGHWLDIGTPDTYLQANLQQMPPGGLIDPSSTIHPSARVVDSVVGPGSVIGERATVERSVLLPGARVRPGAELNEAVVGVDGEPVW